MGIGDNLRGVEALFKSINLALTEVRTARRLRRSVECSCFVAQINGRREASFVDRRSNQTQGLTILQRVYDRPLARALLTSSIEDLIDKILTFGVSVTQDLGGDFNEVAAELTSVPASEDFAHLIVGLPTDVAKIGIGISDELHITILDAVVDHLDEVTRTTFTYPSTARSAVLSFGSNTGEYRLDARPCFFSASRHNSRAIQCSFFTSGDTTADEIDTVLT